MKSVQILALLSLASCGGIAIDADDSGVLVECNLPPDCILCHDGVCGPNVFGKQCPRDVEPGVACSDSSVAMCMGCARDGTPQAFTCAGTWQSSPVTCAP
jgi:hypothetical protein